jgi:hypothetical protein
VLMCLGELEDHWPLACLTQQVDPHKIMKHPPRRRMLNPFTLLVGKRCLMIVERLADTVFQGRVDQQSHRHDHQQRHDPLGLFEIER